MCKNKAKRKAAVADDGVDRHIRSLGLRSAEQYLGWCEAHGFPPKLRKHANVRKREHQFAVADYAKYRRESQRQLNADPLQAIAAICAGTIREGELQQPQLVRLHSALAVKDPPRFERHIDRKLLLHVLHHLHGCRSTMFSNGFVIPALGAQVGNTYLEALAVVVANASWWLRPIEAWRPRSHNARRQFAALLRHLFVRYEMPDFFDSAWFAGRTQVAATQRSWYLHVGTGSNIRTCDLPIAYTKRMAHYFMRSPSELSVEQAIRYGQILGLGGEDRLARAIVASRVGTSFENDEFWSSVLRWFIAAGMFDYATVGPMVDFLHHQRFVSAGEAVVGGRLQPLGPAQPNLSMRGRTIESVLEQVTAWHRRLAHDKRQPIADWKPSGITPFEFLEGDRDQHNHRVWSIFELLSAQALVAEGRAMRHCVASYAYSCARGTSSIWTMERKTREGTQRLLTLEVHTASRRIVQARGRANRRPEQRERDMLCRWAAAARLVVANYL